MASESDKKRPEWSSNSIRSALEAACNAFEEELKRWRAGERERPAAEGFLKEIPRAEEWTFVRELVLLEADYRQQAGEPVDADEYRRRFEPYASQIDDLFLPGVSGEIERRRLGSYELLERLGGGGMGEVYKARHLVLREIRALKILRRSLFGAEPDVKARLQVEAETGARLKHPNIVHTLDAGMVDDEFFVATEYIDGRDLEKLVKEVGPLAVPAACEVVRQAAIGLQHAHENFVVHRDIKPPNLMLTTDGTVKILDFGLARLRIAKQITRSRYILGTADFMAPEQFLDSKVEVQADIYSLGCTLYYLLAGNTPYSAEGTPVARNVKLAEAHRKAPIPSLQQERPEASDLQPLLNQLMAKKAGDRYQTPGQVAKELEQFADDAQLRALVEQPAGPSDLGKGSRASGRARRRWYRRREFLVSAAGGLAAAVAFPIIYSLTRGRVFRQPEPEGFVNIDFVTLVGLTGRWWFDEIPYLIPEFRASSAGLRFPPVQETTPGGAPKQERPLLDRDVAKVHQQLRNAFDAYLADLGAKDPQRSGLIHDVLWDLSRSGLSEEESKSVVDSARKLDDPHLLGLVQHKLDQPDADVSYKNAIQRYTSEINKGGGGADVHRALLALCYSDLAAWQFKQNKYADAVKNFQHVRQTLGARNLDAPLLEAASLCGEVLGLRRLARTRADWDVADQRMSRAFRIAEEHLDALHPLRAYLHERRAWTLMDQWRLSEAKHDFEEAIKLHQAALGMKSAPARPQQRTLARIFHNMHGLAMTDRFAGRLDDAHQSYAVVLEDVSAQLDQPQSQGDQELTERLVNTAERLGDLWLFRASPEPKHAQSYYDAAFGYASEISGTTVTSGDPDPDTVQARILLKRTLALILMDQPEETASEVDELKRILAPYEAAPYTEGKLYADTALGLILLAGGREGAGQGRKKLRAVLQTVLQDSGSQTTKSSAQYGLRRDTFELLLFVWARLLVSEYPEAPPEVEPRALLADIDTVFRIRPEVLPDPSLLSYLKPHYDLALKAEIGLSEQADPGTIVRHVAMANKTSGFVAVRLLRKPILCFYFFRKEKDGGYALLFEPGRPLYKSKLELSEAGIAALANSQTRVALPQELQDRLQQCEQPVVIDWKAGEFFPFECPPNAEVAAADDRVRGG